MLDIEDVGTPPSKTTVSICSDEDKTIQMLEELITKVNNVDKETKATKATKEQIDKFHAVLKRKYRISPSKADMRHVYEKNFPDDFASQLFKKWMIKRSTRNESGVLVATITLSPHKFSCKYDCFYCPQETDLKGVPTQPRSYLSTEPAMLRAIQSKIDGSSYDFDVRNQFKNRIKSYLYTGNIKKEDTNSKKMEVILSGGTWESYPIEYREQVMNELYWAANTIETDRPIRTLEEEIEENETTKFRIIGLTIETRPDNITPQTIQDYCRWGVTRVQIGVQHFNDAILKKINRRCYTVDTIRAIRLLKQACFKVVVHLMPDLPGSSPEEDMWMFDQAIQNPDLQFDDVKIYPTAVCKSPDSDRIVKSKIADWYKDGSYVPYAEKNLNDLIRVISHYKKNVQPWIRIQRIVRDIPGKSIESGYKKKTNLRQMIQAQTTCNCIFCKEIGDKEFDNLNANIVVRKYKASDGIEYFVSLEAHKLNPFYKFLLSLYILFLWIFAGGTGYWQGNAKSYIGLFGFLRLRLDPNPGGDFLPEIHGCALIREVHVYGSSMGVGKDAIGSQHRGYGQKLMKVAEKIALKNGYKRAAVIAGVGTREYYKNKCGYEKVGTYMIKNIR